MTLNHRFKVRSLILAASLSVSASFLSPAFAQVPTLGQVFTDSYLIDLNAKEWTKLETLGEFTRARAINDSGQVVGQSGQGTWLVTSPFVRTGFITGPNGAGITRLSMSDSNSTMPDRWWEMAREIQRPPLPTRISPDLMGREGL